MKHLTEEQLALLGGGDLPFWQTWHGRICPHCRERATEYAALRKELREQTEQFRLPKGFDWAELEGEMMGNIRLGTEVSRATPPMRRIVEEWMDWRGIIAVGALSAVVMTGWFLGGPARRNYPQFPGMSQMEVASGAATLKGSPIEIGWEERGAGVYFRSAAPTATRVAVGLDGSVRTAAVDQESGQLTVTQVSFEDEEETYVR
jgi:hypothetical protein